MRARLALVLSEQPVYLREIKLREKPDAFLAASSSATVPALDHGVGVIDESLDIMVWALERNDPHGLLDMPQKGWEMIATNDGPFKIALDRTKYATRYPDENPTAHRAAATAYLMDWDAALAQNDWLLGERATLADYALLPFVRQFAFIDRAWFDAQDWPHLIAWLDRYLASDLFARIMPKFPQWAPDSPPITFPS